MRLALQNREDMLRSVVWSTRYSLDWPTIPELPIHEWEAVRHRTQELRPALKKAVEQFNALSTRLLEAMRGRDEATGHPWLARFIGEEAFWPANSAWQSLNEVLDYQQDIRRQLIGFCWNYTEAKTWLIRVLGLLQWPSEMASDYERWREADQALDSELEKLLARTSLQSVREHIQRVEVVEIPPWLA